VVSIRQHHIVLGLLAAIGCSSISSSTGKPSQPSPTPAPSAQKSTAASLGIPPGHLPAPGQCRIWIPGTPPGHQAKSRSCVNVEKAAPAGSWIVYRPSEDKKVVHVRAVDQRKPGLVVQVRVYDAVTGGFIREG
jgi:hypothetical protein